MEQHGPTQNNRPEKTCVGNVARLPQQYLRESADRTELEENEQLGWVFCCCCFFLKGLYHYNTPEWTGKTREGGGGARFAGQCGNMHVSSLYKKIEDESEKNGTGELYFFPQHFITSNFLFIQASLESANSSIARKWK